MHPNQHFQQYQHPYPRQQQGQSSNFNSNAHSNSLEDVVKTLVTNTAQFQQETRASIADIKANIANMQASIQSLATQVGQLVTTVSRLEAQGYGRLPSQTVMNPRENVSAITLRSGKVLEEPEKKQDKIDEDNVKTNQEEDNDLEDTGTTKRKFPPLSEYKSVPPFSSCINRET